MNSFFSDFKSFQTSGSDAYKPGLDRMLTLDREAGCPHRRYRCIHVAGTNGKGSVSNMIAACLAASGLKVGLYTSPHILDLRERARIRDASGLRLIPEEAVQAWAERWGDRARELPLSFFEVTTSMAFSWFADEGVDVAVIECGLGGRLDSTNIISPELSVITNIGYDHCDILGDTLAQIASEKAGIIKSGVPVVIGECLPETRPVFEAAAAAAGAPLHLAELECPPLWERHAELLEAMDLGGNYQRANLRTVLCALSVLGVEPSVDALIHTASLMEFHGRWERLLSDPELICDIGHNAHGLRWNFARLTELTEGGRPLVMVYGSVADKDVDAVLRLMPRAAMIYFTNAEGSRALPAGECCRRYEDCCAAAGLRACERRVVPSVADALSAALEYARSLENAGTPSEARPLIYVGGSTYVVAEAIAALRA